jgi:adenine-specific DNA-methyltransferase
MAKNSTAALAASVNVVVPLRPDTSHRAQSAVPSQAAGYPELRYMGSKKRLLPWIHQVLDGLDFGTALDPFAGTGCVAYLMKSMGRRVIASDFLNFSSIIARATIENSNLRLDGKAIKRLIDRTPGVHSFIERTFSGVFFTRDDLRFLDRVFGNIQQLEHPHEQALAFAALFRRPLLLLQATLCGYYSHG